MPLAREKKQEVIDAVRRQGRRHRVARGPDRAPDGADPGPDGAPPPLPEGQPFAPRPPQARGSAPAPSRVPGEEGRHALSGRHRLARTPPLGLAITDPGTLHPGSFVHPAPGLEAPAPPAAGRSIPLHDQGGRSPVPTPTTLEIEFGGRQLILETGRLAGNAGGAVTARYGDSMVLGTANRSEPRPGLDFFPLTVDFEERMYAAGKIPGGFIKREGRASEAATLAARLTDRPIRPLFPEGYKDDVQIVITTLSTDHENELDVLGTIAASAALTISEIPFQGPIGAVHVGRIDGEFVLNPTTSQLAESRARPRRLRHPRRDHDGRGGREDPARGRHGRGDHVRPPVDRAAHRPPGEAARAGRQAQAPAVPRARSPTPCSSSPSSRRRAASSSSSTSRRPARTPRWPTSSRSPRSASRAARSPTAGPRS